MLETMVSNSGACDPAGGKLSKAMLVWLEISQHVQVHRRKPARKNRHAGIQETLLPIASIGVQINGECFDEGGFTLAGCNDLDVPCV